VDGYLNPTIGSDWFRPVIEPEVLNELCVRRNLPAVMSTVMWILSIIVTSSVIVATWGSWWLIPAMIAHGVTACGAADARWHECGHGTAFAFDRANDAIYWVASFLLLREPTVWRWSHARHHSETIMVGTDPEIAFPRPPRFWVIAANLIHLHAGWFAVRRIVLHSLGRIDPEVADYVPESDHRRVIGDARIFLGLMAVIAAICVLSSSILPAVVIGFPAFYGAWVVMFFGATQHAGLAQNVTDHRLSTRTVKMNPVFRFLYLNMNHHTEHHLFPTVPYHRLPDLHTAIADELPAPIPSTWAAYRQILPTLWTQRHDVTHELRPGLPTPNALQSDVPSAALTGEMITREIITREIITVDQVTTSTLEPGQMCSVRTGDTEALLCRITAEDWVLTDALCTHGDARLVDGVLTGWTLECPRHNGRFDLRDGRAIRRPVTVNLNVTDFEPPG
jgi:Na+-transporting NADH:ubiquinone oxidoreductase subunit F